MKKILIIGASLAIMASAAAAQDSASGAASQSASNVNVNVASISNTGSGTSKVKTTGTTRVETVGVTSGPAVFGGGHPCLAGQSGSIGVMGGALGYGQGNAEPICMLKLLGQDEAALILLASSNNGACKALAQAGAIVSDCGGSIKQPVVSTKSVKTAGWNKCEYDATAHKVTWRPKGDKAASKAACLAHLGF